MPSSGQPSASKPEVTAERSTHQARPAHQRASLNRATEDDADRLRRLGQHGGAAAPDRATPYGPDQRQDPSRPPTGHSPRPPTEPISRPQRPHRRRQTRSRSEPSARRSTHQSTPAEASQQAATIPTTANPDKLLSRPLNGRHTTADQRKAVGRPPQSTGTKPNPQPRPEPTTQRTTHRRWSARSGRPAPPPRCHQPRSSTRTRADRSTVNSPTLASRRQSAGTTIPTAAGNPIKSRVVRSTVNSSTLAGGKRSAGSHDSAVAIPCRSRSELAAHRSTHRGGRTGQPLT